VAEPEDVLAEGALHVTTLARDLWARRSAGKSGARPQLDDLRRRLDILVAALFPAVPAICLAEPPAPPSFLSRLARRPTAHIHSPDALAFSDGRRIGLPATLNDLPAQRIAGRYRVLALEQAARVWRGTHAAVPATSLLVRDLFLLAEAAAVDAMLAAMLPRYAAEITEARREALAARPRVRRRSAQEAAVECLVESLLSSDPEVLPPPFIRPGDVGNSEAWAESQRQGLSALKGPYRGMAPVPLWGIVSDATEGGVAVSSRMADEAGCAPGRTRTLPRSPVRREAAEDEDDSDQGTWMVRADDLQEKAEDAHGLQRPADRDGQQDPGELADALSELPEARLVRTPGPVAEVLAGADPIARALVVTPAIEAVGLAYPEWDWQANTYRSRAAVVRERVGEPGSAAWVEQSVRRHASVIRLVRRDFERLRPRRMAVRRQPEGAELDIDALVTAYADRHGRGDGVVDDRYYVDTRPARRDIVITLLVDVSASTDGWVAGDRRIIDVEKEALLIVREALAALGDSHAILAFSSDGPRRVTVLQLKRFDDHAGAEELGRRIAGLEPGGYTRAGAALRHATAGLGRYPARHRLLLVLSDGRPNDIDQYEGRYGIEDTRMAIAEARLHGIRVFCLTVDRQAPRWASRIFGRDFTVLSRPERLPRVLTSLLRDLVR
jgi:nitric oxide reductase NorD protein